MKTITKQLVDEAYVLMYVLVNVKGGGRLSLKAAQRYRRRVNKWETTNEVYWDREEAEKMAAQRVKELRDGQRQM